MVDRVSLQPELGARLKALRNERGLRLADVSAETGISASFLSLVESGRNDLTITRLSRLCRYYGLSILEVLPRPEQPDPVVLRRGQHRHFFSPAEGIDIFLLAPDTERLMMPVRMEFEPGGELAESTDYPGDTFLIVVEGRLEVLIDEMKPVILEEGDTVYLTAGRRYQLRNPDAGRPARIFGVVSPPIARAAFVREDVPDQ